MRNWLEFAGIGTKKIPLISVEQHFAEKLHAYTLPRKEGINSRVKDLIDLVLLIQGKKTKANLLQIAIYKTFKRRSTHKLPIEILPPPKEWEAPFAVLAEQCDLNLSVTEAYKKLYAFWKKMELPRE
ncbi:MAG: nucleotidyl transferase AbiEii/AbiGii toxin family protein [Deltaproteobacteria bacterium]|nr:nucleotidyl transferase AbiEii/AbiGii toxin family protein [Deltaproteobacteria bacterium]